ncbi:MAG: META domain-containing protein [Methanolinea sp.]|nr:META domain-containing protein [Methanolinea sp.]
MIKRSLFQHSLCLLLAIALLFGAMGAVQAQPQSTVKGKTTEFSSFSLQKTDTAFSAGIPGKVVPLSGRIGESRRIPVPGGRAALGFPAGNNSHRNETPLYQEMKEKVPKNLTPLRNIVSGKGTVVYVDLEGGFFGIIGDDGSRYLPDTLPPSCRAEGTRVSFMGFLRPGVPTIKMWGIPLRILSVQPLGEEITAEGTIRYVDLEGGFYGIESLSGTHYLPLNLPEKFEVDGLEVSFTARTSPGTATVQMWGIPVTILTIQARSPPGGPGGDTLAGTWILTELARENGLSPAIRDRDVTAVFGDNGQVSGTAGCNLYSAPYSAKGHTMEVGVPTSTMMYCPDVSRLFLRQETIYLQLLGEAASWEVRGTQLVIRDAGGREILVFERQSARDQTPLVEFWRTGGFAGMNDHLVILPDGTAVLERKEYTASFLLPPAVLQSLEEDLAASGFGALAPSYRAPPGSADYFTYQITYKGKTVTADDGAVPPALLPVIEALTQLVIVNGPDDIIPPAPR